LDLQAHLVADAFKKVLGMLSHSRDIQIAFQVLISFLELISVAEDDTTRLPYPVVLGFMSMEALPAVKMLNPDRVLPRASPDGSCIMTRIIRTGALPALQYTSAQCTLHHCHL
jgi:hypothetical protein